MDGWGGSHFRRETGFSGLQIQEPQHQKIPGEDFRISIWNNTFCLPYDHDDQQPGRKRGVFYQTVGQPVSFFYRDLDEIYIRGFLIIIEGPFYISVEIDHLKLVRYPGKKGALNGNGHQDNAEYQINRLYSMETLLSTTNMENTIEATPRRPDQAVTPICRMEERKGARIRNTLRASPPG